MKKILLALLLCPMVAFAQTPISDGGTVIVDCDVETVDISDSSPAGNYGPGENHTITVCPEDGNYIEFNTGISGGTAFWDMAEGDVVLVYDGLDDTAPLIGMYTSEDEFGFVAASSLGNASGCLTIVFVSISTSPGAPGFIGTVSCNIVGQPFITTITTDPQDVEGYVDICSGEEVTFTAETNYQYNGTGYDQSDLTSNFIWNFGGGNVVEGIGLTTVSETFIEQVGIQLNLTVVDVFGQESYTGIKIRVSTTPSFAGVVNAFQDSICLGNSSTLIGTIPIDLQDSTGVVPTSGSFVVEGIFDNALALPDGGATDPDDPEYYSTVINFSNFPPGSTLDNIDDLISICVNMNHTYTSDLEMWLICPGGDTLVLFDAYFDQATGIGLFPGGVSLGGTDLGNPPNEGYTYCFTVTAPSSFQDVTDNPVPEGDYLPMSDINNLVGCPLNGDWTLQVGDYFGSDAGNIYYWTINFNQDIIPDIETYLPALLDGYWADTDDDIIEVSPPTLGQFDYNYIVEDDFGCSYDTTVVLTVVEPVTSLVESPACFNIGDLVVNDSYNGGSWDHTDTPEDANLSFNLSDSIVIVTMAGDYTLTYTDNLCEWTQEHNVFFVPLPIAEIIEELDICQEEPELITAEPQHPLLFDPIFQWSFEGDTLGSEESQEVQEAGEYQYRVYDPVCNTWSSPATLDLTNRPCVIGTFNVFTPNGDGKNDFFSIESIEEDIYRGSELMIYNRWGNIVHEAVNYKNNWDMNDIEDGTYFFVLNVSNGDKHTGSFTVIR